MVSATKLTRRLPGKRPRSRTQPTKIAITHGATLRRFLLQREGSITSDLGESPVPIARQRVSLEIVGGSTQPFGLVTELPQPTVAVEAGDATHLAGRVIVVDVLRSRTVADRTGTALLFDEALHISRADSVASQQVVVPISTIETFLCLFAARVVTWLAIRVTSVLRPTITRELFRRFPFITVGTALHVTSVRRRCDSKVPAD